jgi:signal transduction histidine kinase
MNPDEIRHALKNQLGIVIGFTELLLADAADDEGRRDDLQEIHAAATNALALVERYFGRPEEQA